MDKAVVGLVGPDAVISLVVDRSAETAEILFYRDDNDIDGILVAMTGTLNDLERVRWFAQSAAKFHNIQFQETNNA